MALFLLSSGAAGTWKWGCRHGEEWMEASLLNLFSLGPFVRARLSPSPAVKGRIVAPAASLVLMSPDANLTHG